MSKPAQLAAAFVLCAMLASCGQSKPEEAPSAEAATAPEPTQAAEAEAAPEPQETPETASSEDEPATPAPAAPDPVERAEALSPPPAPQPAVRPAAFARCQACHSTEPGAGHGIGPNLVGVMGSRVGSRNGYDYSDAMAASDQTWTPELMDAFLQGPRDIIPGTKMLAAPVRNEDDRQALIDYLSSLR